MRESASDPHSYIRSKAEPWAWTRRCLKATDVHCTCRPAHIPKDGPSAGVGHGGWPWRASSAVDRAGGCGHDRRGDPARPVLPVGGIKMKVLAAHRAGLNHRDFCPNATRRTSTISPRRYRDTLRIVPVDRIDEAMNVGLRREARQEISISLGRMTRK